ncbi:amino acid ABC transporter permease [Paramagnetospirillum kuznetsovii]|uniref:Amino acid ABC transporter permease n=1 Tax=Paramagnetospirillum kuznetsovii TaxID=2053833 RepID=A0A364NVE4_9PROT|nr:ABC transporter permease subunit [Paramagnetospirillum kuznetsovii]RAU20875.1 amino acid ABC transporter permease [Paramagnetospirillum kuznetsovii]
MRVTGLWGSARFRGVLYQALVIGGVVALGSWLLRNTLTNLEIRGIATGFGFLGREAGFDISESLIAFTPADTYSRALVVGLLNTLLVSALGIVLATVLGTVVGVVRLSGNWLLGRLATLYVESIRNVPLLLQLFVWYGLVTALPGARQALNPLPGVFLSNRGLVIPALDWSHGWPLLDSPHLAGFNFTGGLTLSPEFAALLAGLTFYTAAFIAEIVRAGILSVPKGQVEAALSLGLSRGQILRLVVLPQALRVIVPPLTSQYLNICKNSPLAIAIGYPDLVAVSNTAINQTGQAVEGVALVMGVFLCISLGLSALMNWYNKRVALVTK